MGGGGLTGSPESRGAQARSSATAQLPSSRERISAQRFSDPSLLWEFPNLVVSNLVVCNFCAEALFCTLLRPFALFCRLAFVLFCVRPRLERPRLGAAESLNPRGVMDIRAFGPWMSAPKPPHKSPCLGLQNTQAVLHGFTEMQVLR